MLVRAPLTSPMNSRDPHRRSFAADGHTIRAARRARTSTIRSDRIAPPRRGGRQLESHDGCCADWHVGQVFFSLLWFALFFIWIWLLFMVFADLFRDHKLSSWWKALWVIFIIVFPFLGVLIYLIGRGGSMHDGTAVAQVKQDDQDFQQYVARSPARGAPRTSSSASTASASRA